MRNRIIAIILVVSLIPLIACSESAPGPSMADQLKTYATQTDIATVKSLIDGKVSKPDFDSLVKRVDTVAGGGTSSTVNAYPKDQTYTRSEIDAMIAALKSNQSWITGVAQQNTSNTTIPPGTATGQIQQFPFGSPSSSYTTSPNGNVESLVNWGAGSNVPITSSSIPNTGMVITYTQRLINHNTALMYVRPTITLGISTQYQSYYGSNTYFTGINVTMLTQQGVLYGIYTPPSGWAMANIGENITKPQNFIPYPISVISQSSPTTNVGTTFTMPAQPYTFNLSPGLMILTNTLQLTPSSGLATQLGEIMIQSGQAQDITVTISSICTSTQMNWSISTGCSSHL